MFLTEQLSLFESKAQMKPHNKDRVVQKYMQQAVQMSNRLAKQIKDVQDKLSFN